MRRVLVGALSRQGTLWGTGVTPGEILRRLRGWGDDPAWHRFSDDLAHRMVWEIATHAGRTWRQAAQARRPSATIAALLQQDLTGRLAPTYGALIAENAGYIRSVPQDIAREFTAHIATRAVAGLRSPEIADELRALYPHTSRVKAALIARTETSKTHTAIEAARAQSLGLPWYQWETVDDQRVRASHRKMDHVLVPWDDPPAPEALAGEKPVGVYHAGNIWNCRCSPESLLLLDDVTWPARVYHGGVLTRMTRGAFAARFWTPDRVAAHA